MEAQRVNGRWWLPETPKNECPGTLAIDESGSAELLLIGSLQGESSATETTSPDGTTTRTFTRASLAESGRYPRIHGEAKGTSYNLENCFRTSLSGGFFGPGTEERINVNQVLRGVWFGAGEDIEFDEARTWMQWLTHWVMQSGLEEDIHH